MDICEYLVRLEEAERHPWEIARARFIAGLVGDYFLREYRPVRLVDFGCGDGFVTKTLASRYASCHLIGVDQKIHDLNCTGGYVQDVEKIKYLQNLEEYRGKDGTLDGGLLLDVLEHIADDESFLYKFLGNKIFAEDAIFVITCPAFQSIYSHHDSLLGHFRRYSLLELKNKVERAGGNHLESGYIFLIPLILRIVEVFLEKKNFLGRRERTYISTWRGGRLTTSFISWVVYVDAFLCRGMRKFPVAGLTCYIICRKRAS